MFFTTSHMRPPRFQRKCNSFTLTFFLFSLRVLLSFSLYHLDGPVPDPTAIAGSRCGGA